MSHRMMTPEHILPMHSIKYSIPYPPPPPIMLEDQPTKVMYVTVYLNVVMNILTITQLGYTVHCSSKQLVSPYSCCSTSSPKYMYAVTVLNYFFVIQKLLFHLSVHYK